MAERDPKTDVAKDGDDDDKAKKDEATEKLKGALLASKRKPSSEKPETGKKKGGPPSFRKLALATVGLLLLCEIVARIYLSSRQSRLDDEIAKGYPPNTYVTAFASRQDYRFINLYTMNPERGSGPEYRFDKMGFRLDRRNLAFGDAKAGKKHIWMLGGSTAQGLGLRESETIAAQLNDLLEKDGSEWRVLNMGQGGHTTTQELLLLTELLQAGHRPDAILCYDGINDIPFEGEVDNTGAPGWEKRTVKSRLLLDVQGAETSSALTFLAISRWTKLDDFMSKVAGRLGGQAGVPAADKSADRGGTAHPGKNWGVVAQRYLTNLSLIRAAADMLNVPAVFYFQPVMQYEDHYKIRTYSEQETKKLIPEMANNEWARREAVVAPERADLRAKLGDRFHDLHDVFHGHDGETLYADPRHPNGTGAGLVAARIYGDLKALKAPPSGVE